MTYPLPAQCSAAPCLYRYTALFSHAVQLGISQWEQCDTIVKSTLLILYRETVVSYCHNHGKNRFVHCKNKLHIFRFKTRMYTCCKYLNGAIWDRTAALGLVISVYNQIYILFYIQSRLQQGLREEGTFLSSYTLIFRRNI